MKANEKDTFRHNGYNAFANGVGDMGQVLHGMAISIDKYALIRFLKPIVAALT